MENILCTPSLEIQTPAGNYLTPTDYIGAGANGFVLKVSDNANNISALKIVPVIVRPNEENADRTNRERQFYQHMKKAYKIPNLVMAISWWSVENVETSAYLKLNKELRKRLNTKAQDLPSRVVKETPGEFKLRVHFVQMEYYTSGNLKAWLQCNSNKCKETYSLRTKLFKDILSAVDFLHKRGLMHRDICPNNIFLTKDNDRLHAVLGDFDTIVSCGEQALWPLTKVRETFTSVMGTDPYAAPEIYGGNYDKQCDLFSLGVIALNLLFNIVDYKELRQAIYQIQVRNVFPTCILGDNTPLVVDIVKAQLSNAPEHRMSSNKLLEIIKTMMQSLYLLGYGCNSLIKLQGFQSNLVELSQVPEPVRVNFSMTACESKMYVIGGYEKNTVNASNIVQQYDTQAGWRDLPPMLEERSSCGAAALGDRLFVVGGYDGKKLLSSAEECDLETGRWAHVAPMTATRLGVSVAALSNLLFAVGGWDGDSYLNSIEYYDPRAGRWTKAAPMHEFRRYHGCATLDDRLYVAGGWTGVERIASVEWFDLRVGRWTRVRDMGAPRSSFALAALNGQLLAAGGYTSVGEMLDTVEVYDEMRDAWSALDVRLPCRQGSWAGCVVEV